MVEFIRRIAGLLSQRKGVDNGIDTGVINQITTLNHNDRHSHFAKQAKVVGVHKRESPKVCYLFIIIVRWNDKSQVAIYRNWPQILELKEELLMITKNRNAKESRLYLKRTAREVKNSTRFYRGMKQKLKMIDALNQFFEAVLHFPNFKHSEPSKRFFKPTEKDMTSTSWSGDGRTYFYINRDILGRRGSEFDDFEPQNIYDGVMNNGFLSYIDEDKRSKAESVYEADVRPPYSFSEIGDLSSKTKIYIVLCDFTATGEDDRLQNVLSVQKGEEVEVLQESEKGWWLVKKLNTTGSKENVSGYVPASYLRPKLREVPDLESQRLLPLIECEAQEENSFQSSSVEDSQANDQPPKYKDLFDGKTPFKVEISRQLSVFKPTESTTLLKNSVDCITSLPKFPKNQTSTEKRILPKPLPRRRTFTCMRSSEPTFRPRPRSHSEVKEKIDVTQKMISDVTNSSYWWINEKSQQSSSGSSSVSRRSSVVARTGLEYISTKAYHASEKDEISFNEGVIIKVLRKNSDGWWLASYNERTGLVPGVHLRRYRDPIRRVSLHVMELS